MRHKRPKYRRPDRRAIDVLNHQRDLALIEIAGRIATVASTSAKAESLSQAGLDDLRRLRP